MDKQHQKVSDDSVAVQSGRDTNVSTQTNILVVTPEHMREVLAELATQVDTYTAEAEVKKNERLEAFGQKVVDRFAKGTDTRAEAFTDPDFQYAIARAQHAYARSGDEAVADMLVGIIARRSMEEERTRAALSLDEAVDKAARLTKNEFAALGLSFVFRYSRHTKLGSLAALGEYFQTWLPKLLPDISTVQSCYAYLETQSCASVSIAKINFRAAMIASYPGLLSKGIERKSLEGVLSTERIEELIDVKFLIPCINDNERLQPDALHKDDFDRLAVNAKLDKAEADSLWRLFDNSLWSKEEMLDRLEPHIPQIRQLQDTWDESPLSNLNLTAVGFAIAHANIRRLGIVTGDLNIWIQ
jgi:antitoxin component of MazEF toxin-antitoxin module